MNFDNLVELFNKCVENEITMDYNYLLNLLGKCTEIQKYEQSRITATNIRKDPIYMIELYLTDNTTLNDFNLWIGFVSKNECIIISLFNMCRARKDKTGYIIQNNGYSYELITHTF